MTERELAARLRASGCVFAEDEARLLLAAASTPAELDATVARRVGGEPLEVVLGWAEFCGLRIAVDAGVFVPRQRTAFLVEHAVTLSSRGAVVVDLCCGTGAIGAAVAARIGEVELHAADVDPVAVRCARRNVAAMGGRCHAGDLYEPLPSDLRGRVDSMLVNAPYVPTDEMAMMPPEAREHEPRVALDGGADGLDVQRRVAAKARDWLAPGGRLLIETGRRQASTTAEIVAEGGLIPRTLTSDEHGATIVVGAWPGPSRLPVSGRGGQ